ncbi:MAG: hypothetical protein F7C35_02035 [Desulfurococcales archaeon]|nr:hypothetical protein [Desulfurococcales archaeon]
MEPIFDKIVVVSGTSGVGLSYVMDKARTLYGDQAAYASYEEYVKEIGKAGIYTAASNLLWTPSSALDVFSRAYNAMVDDLLDQKRAGAEIAFIETHLSYISVHSLIPNPILHRILSLGREATILYYVDDFYHSLLRMALRIREAPNLHIAEGFIIDPLSYLYWRGLDHSLLIMLRAQIPNIETLLVGAKHPEETHSRILQYAGLPTHKARRRFLLAYMSHPISGVRSDFFELYKRGELKSLSEHPFVKRFETFKRKLRRRCSNLILFEPTTVDEIVTPENETTTSYRVTKDNRWPHGREHEYEDLYPVDIFDNERFGPLYGASFATASMLRAKTTSILDYGDEVRAYYISRLLAIVKDQIEVRDYEYVAQSSAVFAYEPIYKSIVTGEANPSRGVRKEINRAESQAKAIYVTSSEETIHKVADQTAGLFGERVTPIKLSDPSDPEELIQILREGRLC